MRVDFLQRPQLILAQAKEPLSELGREEESLQERIEITSGALIGDSADSGGVARRRRRSARGVFPADERSSVIHSAASNRILIGEQGGQHHSRSTSTSLRF